MMSSVTPIESPFVINTANGSLQLSVGGETVGLLVERDGMALGTLLDEIQVQHLLRVLLSLSPSDMHCDRLGAD